MEYKYDFSHEASYLISEHPESAMLVEMSPSDFLDLAPPVDHHMGTVGGLGRAMERGDTLPLPFLIIVQRDGMCKVVEHEGRHRARAAELLGIEALPVLLMFEDMDVRSDIEAQMCCRCHDDWDFCSCLLAQELTGRIRSFTFERQEIDYRQVPDIAHATPRWRREHGFDF